MGNIDKSYMGGIPIDWDSGGSLEVSTSSHSCEIQDAFRGFDTARFLQSMVDGLLFGNGNIA